MVGKKKERDHNRAHHSINTTKVRSLNRVFRHRQRVFSVSASKNRSRAWHGRRFNLFHLAQNKNTDV
jgi:hypothetical protein